MKFARTDQASVASCMPDGNKVDNKIPVITF